MSDKTLTVKVNYELGTTTAFVAASQQAAVLAQQAQSNARATANAVTSAQQQIAAGAMAHNHNINLAAPGKPKSMLENFLGGGIGGMLKSGGLAGALGLAAYGAIGTGAGDFQNFMGGTGLRGHGFSGMADSVYGFLTGRATKEAHEDRRMELGDTNASLMRQRLTTQAEVDSIIRSGSYRPITEVNPLKKIEAERLQMGYKHRQMQRQAMNAQMDALGAVQDFPVTNDLGTLDGQINTLKMNIAKQEDVITRKKEMQAFRSQQVDFEAGAETARRQSIRSDAQRYGSMTPEERMQAVAAGQRLSANQPLTQDEIGVLSQFSSAQDKLNKYLTKDAEGSGISSFLNMIGDDKLKESFKFAQGGNVGINVTIEKLEQSLDEKVLADAIFQQMKKESVENANDVKIQGKIKIELETKLQNLQEKRKAIFGAKD